MTYTLKDTWGERHPSTLEVLKFLDPNPNLKGNQFAIANIIKETADELLTFVEHDSPELTVALRKLLEAKDAFVRASLDL